MSSEKQVRFETKRHQQNIPNELTALFTYLQIFTHLLDGLGGNLLHPIEENFELTQCLFLDLSPRMHLCKRLRLACPS